MVYLDKGYIGNYDAETPEELKAYLLSSINQLKGKRIIAPIDGDTWHKYRIVSWDSGFPPFPLEPQNPLWYNDVYKEIGFTSLAKYHSAAFSFENVEAFADNCNAVYKTFELSDLKTIYDISLCGFDKNFLYDDITYEEFYKLYEPVLPLADSDFILIAYVNGIPCGFVFAIGIKEFFILKTVSVLPEYRKQGIGKMLINKVLVKAKEKGFKTAVGALIIDGNISQYIVSEYGAEKIREYTIYEYTGFNENRF